MIIIKILSFIFLGVCNRTNPADNPCGASAALLGCLETDEFGTPYVCLCSGPSGPAVTTNANCGK
jgi:hypothetical protein